MCDPITMMIASTVMGGYSAIQQGNAAAASAEYSAKVSNMNAGIANENARDALERGKIDEQAKRREIAQITGAQKAGFASSGIDTTFGSPLDMVVDTAMMGEVDALTIRSNAAREAYAYNTDAVNNNASASMSLASAKSARIGGKLSALGSVLGGASDVMKYKASKA